MLRVDLAGECTIYPFVLADQTKAGTGKGGRFHCRDMICVTRASATGTRPRTAVPSDARQVHGPPRRRSENGAFIEASSRLVLVDCSPLLLPYLVLGRHVQYRRLICEICSRERNPTHLLSSRFSEQPARTGRGGDNFRELGVAAPAANQQKNWSSTALPVEAS